MASNSNPPFVFFEVRPVEDRDASIAASHFVSKDVDYICLIPHGSGNTTRVEEVYSDWLAKVRPAMANLYAPGQVSGETPLMEARFPQAWVEMIQEKYAKWKAGITVTDDGTPLINWPAIGPSTRAQLLALYINTVEQLANASDDALSKVMGGMTLRNRARAWIEAKTSDPAKISNQVATLQALAEQQAETIKSLQSKLAELEKERAVQQASSKPAPAAKAA